MIFFFLTQFLMIFIVWLDIRTSETVDKLVKKARNNDPEYLKPLCGLPISTYFSAVKLRWLLDNVKEVQDAVAEGRCLFGTIDTWIIWVINWAISVLRSRNKNCYKCVTSCFPNNLLFRISLEGQMGDYTLLKLQMLRVQC